MLQLEAELQKAGAKTVRFNAWRYDKDDAMWAAFALKFARDLSNQLSWRERWLAHLKLFVSRFNWQDGWRDVIRLLLLVGLLAAILVLPILMQDQIKAFVAPAVGNEEGHTLKTIFDSGLRRLAGAGGGLAYLALIIGLAAKLKDIVGTPLNVNLKQHIDVPDYQSRVSFIERFHEDFGRVAEVYGNKQKVFVFIDDLDRCELPRAADLMQALNLMISDSSYLVFIMGMDREKVAAGLAVKFEKLLPYLAPAPNRVENGKQFDPVLGLEYGYSFIEKFIQLPFLVPQVGSEQLDPFLKKLLDSPEAASNQALKQHKKYRMSGTKAEAAVTEDTEMMAQILEMVAPTFDYNPRRLKQFINTFRLKTFIASRTGLFEEPFDPSMYKRLTVFTLGKFVAISLRWPLLLADLDNNRKLFDQLELMILGGAGPEKVQGDEIDPKLTEVLERWSGRPALRALINFGCQSNTGTYSLSYVNIDKLLQVSPPTPALKVDPEAIPTVTNTPVRRETAAAYPKPIGMN
jgi:hypothetical protein